MPRDGERLLIVRAAAGMDSRWFGAGWVMAGRGGYPEQSTAERIAQRVIVHARSAGGPETLVEQVGTLLDDPDGGRVAVVVTEDRAVGSLAGAFSARVAGPGDLLLTVEEIRAYAARVLAAEAGDPPAASTTSAAPATGPAGLVLGRPPLPLTPERIHEKTGGWLSAVRILIEDPLGARAAKQAILSPLMQWLAPRDPDGAAAAASFLPTFSDEILAAFRPNRSSSTSGTVPCPAPSLRRLQELGLVVRNTEGTWIMPKLVRELLQESVIAADPQRMGELNEAVGEAMATAGGVEGAVAAALRDRDWNRLNDLVLEYWADLYVQNPYGFAKLISRLPRFVIGGTDAIGLYSRLVSTVGPETVDTNLPAAQLDYGKDGIAQWLRLRTEQLYRHPDGEALLLGNMEIGYLRQCGHFEQAGHAAQRLRTALDSAVVRKRIRPVVSAVLELQAGIALHLADLTSEAGTAYESAFFWAQRGAVDFVMADAAGKLALLFAQTGNLAQARRWIMAAEESLGAVTWGKPMVGRALQLARIHVAITEVDRDTVRALLEELPAEPDTDEFWACHAHVIALARIHEGRSEEAAHRIMDWRQDRPHASTSPLAGRLLSEAFHAARLFTGDSGMVPGWDQSEMLANLEALRCLRGGDTDGALRALRLPERISRRHRNIASMIGVLARTKATPETVSETVLRQLACIHRYDGLVADLAAFHAMGWTPAFRRAGMVDDIGAARLANLGRSIPVPDRVPVLTPREHEVLRMLREGMTRKQMATATYRAENTIKGQLRSLYAKLGASSAAEALERARLYGL